ncbi:MAG: glycerol-3-phosphate dehydrogenase, partial [Polaribacter sp.]
GGKLTAFRKMAQKIIDKIQATEKRFGSCKTSHIPLIGSLGFASKGYEMLTDKLPVYTLKFQEQKNLIRLVHSYGNASFEMMDKATDDLSLMYAEIAYCINNESLEHLADYYSRRSGKMLFSSNELLENQSEMLAHFVMLKDLSETQIAKEKELIEQLKTEALGNL